MMAREDVVEVRALPDEVVDQSVQANRRPAPPPPAAQANGRRHAPPREDLSLTQRIGRDRHDRHIAALNKFYADLAAVREEVDADIMRHSERARAKILVADEEAADLLHQLEDDSTLRRMSWQQVSMSRGMIIEQLQSCTSIIDTLYDALVEIESQRVEKLRRVLREAHRLIVSIAHVLPQDADVIIHKEADSINQTMLDNHAAYAELRARLLADRVYREEQMDIQWEILSERWKHFKEQDLTQQCLDSILDLTDYDRQRCKRLNRFREEATALMRQRIDLMKRAAKLAPSFASTAEYPARLRAWQADTQHVHDQYARLHHALRDDLFQLLEQKQNQCNSAVNECLEELVSGNVCSNERARMLVDRECRHACVTALRDSHKETSAFVKALDDVSATLHEEAETLSELCQSLHDQWLQCDTAVAQQEDSVVERIQQLRLLLRQRQQSTEQELDMKIDALRQAGSKDALASLKRVVELHLSQAKRLLEEYGENAKTAPSDHAAKVQTHAQSYYEKLQGILGVVHLSTGSTDTGINIQHLVHTDQGTFRMKRRRWEPTKIGVANQLPQQRSSSRSSSRSTSREGRPGEQSQLFLSTAPKARQVLSRAEGVVEVQWPEADEAASDGQSVRTSRVGSGRSNRSRRSTTQQQRQRQQQQQQPALARTKRRLSHGADAEDAYSVASVDVVGDIGNLMVTRRSNQADGLLEMLSEVDEESEANETGSEQSHRTPAPPPGASTRASKTAVRSHKGSVAARAGKQSYASVGTMTTINSAGNDDIDGDDDGDVGDDGRTQKAGDQGEADAVALAKDPLMRPFARPEIVHVQLASDAVARNVVGAVTLTVHDALEIWGHICTEWLRHAGNFQSVSTEQASDFALSRQREVEAEVDAALEMHDGRMKRIKEDVHDVRAAELMMHQHRVYRHSQAIEQELSEEKERAARLQQQLHREAEQFEKAIDIASGELASKRSRKELDMHREAIEDQYKGYRQVIRGALIEYRKALDGFLRRLKESNAAFRASFRSFTENGNFSSEEIVHYKQVITHVFSRIDGAEGEILTELEGLESEFMTAANGHMERFHHNLGIHHRDVSLLEDTRKLISACKVKIQSEINKSDSTFKKLEATYAQLEKIKFDVTGEADRIFSLMKQLSDGVIEQAAYLNCIKHGAPHSYQGDKDGRSGRGSRLSTASALQGGRVSRGSDTGGAGAGRRTSNTSRATTTSRRRGQSSKQPIAQGRNTVPVAVRGLRLMVEEWIPGRSDSFNHTVTCHRMDCRTAIIHLAVPFYEKGYARQTLRPADVRETIQQYMDQVQDVLGELGKRARVYYEEAVRQLIDLLTRINSTFMDSTKAVFDNITFKCASTHTDAMHRLFGPTLKEKQKGWAKQHQEHMALLRPQLAHPAMATELANINESEEERVKTVEAQVSKLQGDAVEADEQALTTYVQEMNDMVHNLCKIFEDVLSPQELYLPSADPNAAPEVAEMRQKGRFPLIVSGQVMPGRHRRLTSAHGVGMLSTSLHHRAIETRDACVLQAREHFASADNARKEVLKDVRVALELEKRTWQETVTRIRSLTEEE